MCAVSSDLHFSVAMYVVRSSLLVDLVIEIAMFFCNRGVSTDQILMEDSPHDRLHKAPPAKPSDYNTADVLAVCYCLGVC